MISSRIAILWVCGLAFVGILQNFSWPSVSSDAVSANQRRFQEVKRALPKRGQIGYISDLDPASNSANLARVMAQYSLAPLVLVPPLPFPRQLLDPALRPQWQRAPPPTSTPEWFAGDFRDTASGFASAHRAGLIVVRNYGSGVMLLHGAESPPR